MKHNIIWKGIRTPLAERNTVVMNFDGAEFWGNLPLYLSEVNHSPTGFEWGYYGSGPSQLAYAILRSYFTFVEKLSVWSSREQARKHYMRFKEDHVARWKGEEWKITSDEIWVWLGGEKAGWESSYTSGSPISLE